MAYAATDDARSSFLVATYRLLPDLCMIALLDRDGELLVEPISGGTGAGDRRVLSAEKTAELLRTVPLPEGQNIALGQPMLLPDGVVVPVSMRSPFDGGFVLAGALSLDQTRTALERAAELAAAPVVAQGLAKQAIDQGLDGSLADGLVLEQQLFVDVFRTDDARIGTQSFLEHGPGKATFTGR